MSAPQTSMLFNLARNIDSIQDFVETTPEEMLSIEELSDPLVLVWICDVHHVYM